MVGPSGYPDFFIVGAPRTGTTFMFDYLGQHPQVFVPATKEPQFFATDLDSGNDVDAVTFMRDRDEYLALFRGARPDQLTGEASTWYLYSRAAAANIRAANLDARIIAMLRDPVQMLYSLHGRRVYAGSEDINDFGAALAAEEDRRRGARIPANARNVKAFFYRDVGRYSEQVKRYVDTFGRQRVHIVIFEDFVADPAATYRSVLEFLGVDPDFEPRLDVVNAGASRRSQRLHRLLFAPRMIRLARRIVPTPVRSTVGRALDRVNSRPQRRAPLDPDVAARLRAELLPDIERLGSMIGRDLAAVWQ